MEENKKVLVYHHHADGKSVLPGGKALEVITKGELEAILIERECDHESLDSILEERGVVADRRSTDTTLKLTKKAIPPRTTTINIYQKDIAGSSPSTSQGMLPNAEQNVAAVSIPWKVQLGKSINYFLPTKGRRTQAPFRGIGIYIARFSLRRKR